VDTPIGLVPTPDALDTEGLELNPEQLSQALSVEAEEWRAEIPLIEEWFAKIGDKVPSSLHDELASLKQRLS
jgi:phosphoenolpyruvate carboxykinase (GTP)